MKICPVCNSEIEASVSSCPYCGYRMAGSTQAFQPIIVPDAQKSSSDKDVAAAQLKVVKGPQVGNVIILKGDKLTIGRSPQCDVFLNDMTVSRLHATLTKTRGSYSILDHDSFNGLWINNLNVKTALLQDGDVIQIGTFSLVFQSCVR